MCASMLTLPVVWYMQDTLVQQITLGALHSNCDACAFEHPSALIEAFVYLFTYSVGFFAELRQPFKATAIVSAPLH